MTELARAYFHLYHITRKRLWAKTAVENLFSINVDSAWNITLELIEGASDFDDLCYVARKQLLPLCQSSGNEIIDRLKAEALSNNRLLYCICQIKLEKNNPIFDDIASFVSEQLLYRDPKLALDLPDFFGD